MNALAPQLESIRIVHDIDTDPDTSYLGEYTDTINEWAIDRASGEYVHDLEREAIADQLTEWKRNNEALGYRVEFNSTDGQWDAIDPAADPEDNWVDTFDPDGWDAPERSREYRFFLPYAGGETQGTPDYQKYGMQDYARAESLNNGQWCYIGIRAEATIVANGVTQVIRSGGLWGIESDSDREHLESVASEELDSLRAILESLGIDSTAIAEACEDVDLIP